MERLRTEQPKGLTTAGLRKWGMIFLLAGIFGRSILQTRFLGITDLNNAELLETLAASDAAMMFATFSLVLQFVESCAAPIFCLLLAEGFANTSNKDMYLLRVIGVAAISEIPFNFAMSARFIDMSSRNPAFGIAMSLLLLYLYDRFREKKFSNVLLKIAFTVATIFWCAVLKIENSILCLVVTLAFWCFRKKPMIRNLMAGVASMVGSIFSLFNLAAPMALVVIHFYNGEKGEENKLMCYLFYPLALIACGIVGFVAFGF
jgi:hypothetical protein